MISGQCDVLVIHIVPKSKKLNRIHFEHLDYKIYQKIEIFANIDFENKLTLGFQSSSANTTNDEAVNVIAALHANTHHQTAKNVNRRKKTDFEKKLRTGFSFIPFKESTAT